MCKFTPDNVTKLEENEIFVFGSNLLGHHYGGAAFIAFEKFGARWSVGEGLTGKSYAFPTLNELFKKRSIAELKESADLLYATCEKNPDKIFLLTKVGCGIAGFLESEIRDIFTNPPKNLLLPKNW